MVKVTVTSRALARAALSAAIVLLASGAGRAQSNARLAVLQAENRRAPTAQDLATLRTGARSLDGQTARAAIRALGRLERPALVVDIVPGLRHRLADVRAEAANAIAQAAQGSSRTTSLGTAQTALTARLDVEADPGVRAAICEALARLPYRDAADVARAETALVTFAERAESTTDRLGIAKGLEAMARAHQATKPPDAATLTLLKRLAANDALRPDAEALRDARVRRLAVEALITLAAADPDLALASSADPDPQVRRLGVRAAATLDAAEGVITRGLTDPSPMVRIEALRALRTRNLDAACDAAVGAAFDPDTHVSLIAIDQLGGCGAHPDVAALLERLTGDGAIDASRNWHRAAHAIVALAAAAPDRAQEPLDTLRRSRVWQVRMYAARAATALHARPVLDTFARDPHANVAEAALTGLASIAGHAADAQFIEALVREDLQIVRTAALALEGTPARDTAIPALTSTLERVESDARPGAADVRAALRTALTSLGIAVKSSKAVPQPPAPLTLADLRRLAAPRARFTIRDLGEFDVALFTLEAPATVLQFAALAASGYYNGLGFHRIVPNGLVQGGGPGENEFGSGAPLMRDEVGLWPHVRGAIGISTRGRDTGDGQIFIDLVDNPRYDHTYTVFAQILNGLDVVDRILEGDVIDRVEIIP